MPTEEKEEEVKKITVDEVNHLMEKFQRNSLLGSVFDQTTIYKYMSEFAMKFGTPLASFCSSSIMDKIEKFNKAQDEKKEITLDDLEKELDEWTEDKIVAEIKLPLVDDGKEVELEIIHGIGDWHIGRGVDSIWQSEMEQNPHQEQDDFESTSITRAGDDPVEVGRQMHEAIAEIHGISRREDETDEEFRGRIAREGIPPTRIRGTPNRWGRSVGSVFLAHQRSGICWSCQRIGCSYERCTKTRMTGQCAGYVEKPEEKKYNCVICEERLDSPEQFPEGFPDKWKACCYCVEVWNEINSIPCRLVGMEAGEIRLRWEKLQKKFEEVFSL